jgi:hypothetical protein
VVLVLSQKKKRKEKKRKEKKRKEKKRTVDFCQLLTKKVS